MRSERFQLGEHWLSQRRGSDQWCRTWFDASSRQTKRSSLGTGDLERAKVLLAEWYVTNAEIRDARPDDVPVAAVMSRYFSNHGSKLASHDITKLGVDLWTAWWGDRTVADMSVGALEDFAASLTPHYALGTVRRVLTVGKAALNRAHRRQEIREVPFIPLPEASKAFEHVASISQLQAMLNAVPADSHLWLYCLIRLNTACRGDAVLDLSPEQVDTENGIVHLNPAGRTQTKKRRPDVPLTPTLRAALTGQPGTPYVNWNGEPVKSVKRAWRDLCERAGLPAWFKPKILRHTVATELRKRGVPGWEVSALLGHTRGEGSATTGRYAKYAPEWMAASVSAIEKLMAEIAVNVPRLANTPLTRCNTQVVDSACHETSPNST